jgi:MFS family permease
VVGCLVVCVVLATCFVLRLRHAANPLIPPKYFTQRNFVFPLISRGLANYAYFCGFWLTPFILERCFNQTIATTGFYSAFRPVAFAICSPIAGYAAIKVGERTTAVFGAVLLVGSMLAFFFISTTVGIVVVLLALTLSGLGQGIAGPASGATMANQVDPSEFGVMQAATLLSMQIGQVLGAEVSISMQAAMLKHYNLTQTDHVKWPISTFRPAFMVGTIVAVGALICNFFIRSLPREGSRGLRAKTFDDSH